MKELKVLAANQMMLQITEVPNSCRAFKNNVATSSTITTFIDQKLAAN